MPININIEENNDLATVKITQEGKTVSKKIPINSLSESFQNLIALQKDTGYLSGNILREAVKNTVCRVYYFKEFVTTFRYSTHREIVNKTNKYDITIQNEEGRDTLLIPNFKFTNILGFISNSNTDAFNPSCYQILSVVPDLFGNISDESKTVRFFPNQWETYICWPNNFNKEILSNRNINIQQTFVTQYLNSRFNTDLFRQRLEPSLVSTYKDELDTFFREISDRTSQQIYERDSVGWFFLTYFFLVTIKNIEPATLVSGGSTKLKTYFQNYL